MKYFLLIFSLLASCFVSASTRVDQLNTLFDSYRKRFVNGVYVKNEAQIHSFIFEQENFAAGLKASGGLKKILVVTNDYDPTLTVTLYAFVTEQNSLIGFYHEKTSYASDNERSILRFRLNSEFEKGIGFIPIKESYALTVKGYYFKPDASATMQFIYLTDLKSNSVAVLNLFLLKKNNTWDFYNEKYQPVKTAQV